MKTFLSLLVISIALNIFSQNIKSEDLKYNYVKLPSTPIQPRILNYQSYLSSSSDEENAKILAEYEKAKAQADADYDREMAEYPMKVKAADEKYEKAMAEYNDKSLAKKILEKQFLNDLPHPCFRNLHHKKILG